MPHRYMPGSGEPNGSEFVPDGTRKIDASRLYGCAVDFIWLHRGGVKLLVDEFVGRRRRNKRSFRSDWGFFLEIPGLEKCGRAFRDKAGRFLQYRLAVVVGHQERVGDI